MKRWPAIVGLVIVAVAVAQLWSILVDYKWPIVLGILAFGIGLLAWLLARDRKRNEPGR